MHASQVVPPRSTFLRTTLRLLAYIKAIPMALTLRCDQASRLLSERMDRTLEPGEAFALKVHLMTCKWCRRYATQLEILRQLLTQIGRTRPAAHRLSTKARQRIASTLQRVSK